MIDDKSDMKCFGNSEKEISQQRWLQAQEWEINFWNSHNIALPI
jgi:hypothetical protein